MATMDVWGSRDAGHNHLRYSVGRCLSGLAQPEKSTFNSQIVEAISGYCVGVLLGPRLRYITLSANFDELIILTRIEGYKK